MAKLSGDTVEAVRQAADIVEIVSAHTDLRRQGGRWVGLCPFHEERTPSFSVEAQEKLYHCFGCGVGGDVFDFVQAKESIGFPEAVELLADKYGVELKREREDPQAEARRRQRVRLGELLERTAGFYASYLWDSDEAAKARDYLRGRGLEEEVLRDFGVGYAPSAWDQVLTRGQRAGFSVAELRAAGLVQKGRTGGEYDRFRARITFPVRDRRGRVLGFGARALREDQRPKYVNSSETEIYRKSETLYGIDRARSAMAKAGQAIVVEGYTDVLALHQAGIEEAVGIMGTAITDEQIRALSGIVPEVVLALDADSAGQEAMLRAQRVAGDRLRIRVALMPDGTDPADMLGGDGGPERFRRLVEGAVDLPAFQVGLVLGRTDTTSAVARDRALAEAAPVLAQMGEGAARNEQLRRVAEKLDLEPSMVAGRVEAAERAPAPDARRPERRAAQPASGPVPAAALTSRELRERALLAMCISDPKAGRDYLGKLTREHVSSATVARAVEWLRDHLADPLEGLPREDAELHALMAELVMAARSEPASPEAMEVNFLQLEQRRLEDRIGDASDSGDVLRRAELSRERAKLVDRLARTERIAS